MHIRPNYFWRFQVLYWGLTGLLLFLGGLTHLPFEAAFLRNIYFPIAGFLTSFFLIILFEKMRGLSYFHHWLGIITSAAVVAVLCVMVINPITHVQLGNSFNSISNSMLFAGVSNFILYYLLWASLYLHFVDKNITDKTGTNAPHPNETFLVELAGKITPLKVADISHIKAAGDYVEIYLGGKTYTHKSTLNTLEQKLRESGFLKIHRSILVQISHVASITHQSKGDYLVTLKNGSLIKASKTYSQALKSELQN